MAGMFADSADVAKGMPIQTVALSGTKKLQRSGRTVGNHIRREKIERLCFGETVNRIAFTDVRCGKRPPGNFSDQGRADIDLDHDSIFTRYHGTHLTFDLILNGDTFNRLSGKAMSLGRKLT